MEMVLGIFKQLGADETLWIQLGIVIVVLTLANFLFLGHLQDVIEKREEKTVGMEDSAQKQLEEVNKLSEEYKSKVSLTHKEVREKIESEKNSISKDLESKYRTEEKTVNDYIDESRKAAEVKVSEQKEKVLSQADELALSLVQRITKG